MKNGKYVLTKIAFAVLIGYRFFMWDDNKIITYSYVIFEFLSAIVLFMKLQWKFKITKEYLTVFVLETYILILTAIDKGITYSYLCLYIAELLICLYITSCYKKKINELISLLSGALIILFVIDVASIVIVLITGNHTNDSFGIVGHKNYHAFFFILVIGLNVLNNYIKKTVLFDIKTIAISIVSVIVEFIVHSASGIVAVTLMLVLFYLMPIKRIKLFRFNIFITVLLTASILLVLGFTNRGLVNILALLGRDSGFTGRAAIWKNALELLNQRYLYGYGFYKTVRVYFVDLGWVNNHCHNFFLNLMISGGIFYSAIMIIILYKTGKEVDDTCIDYNYILTTILSCYLLLGISEIIVNVNTMLFPLLLLCVYCKEFKKQNISQKSKTLRVFKHFHKRGARKISGR